jgi:predicted Zn finger-like uncharacterized protein
MTTRDRYRHCYFNINVREEVPVPYIRINCPNCKAHFRVDEVHLGKKARCKHCGISFLISRPENSQEPVSATKPIQSAQPGDKPTIRQNEEQNAAVTIPVPDVGQHTDIAKAIAAPAQKDTAEIQREEQEVPIEWEEGQTILDLYEVKKVHTGGGMGLVYKVHHKNWNMDLAVKSPRADYFKTEAQKENFIKECETWINLGLHPNIVSCYYVRTLGGIPRVFAEYVEGGSLKDWIDNKKLYEGGKEKALERILDIAIQFAWGLHYAHEYKDEQVKGLIHQDVKPANVMMTEDGAAKVTDFGLARARAASGELPTGDLRKSIVVSSGGMTPAYCSPEQANKQPLSHKTDIWSWGLSVLEMFVGEVFWRAGQTAPEVLQSYLESGAEDGSIPKIPGGLVELLRRCFQHNPDDRPEDMQEIAARLKGIYKDKDIVGQEYLREEPKAAELLADGLNNRAVSMLDLGKKDEAEKLYNQALEKDPHHSEATYNRGLILWRSGRMTDDELVKQLEEVRTTHQDDWKDKRLLGLVHVERGDAESAVQLLDEAARQAPDDEEVQSALRSAKRGLGDSSKCVWTSKEHNRLLSTVAFSVDACLALTGYGIPANGPAVLWSIRYGGIKGINEKKEVKKIDWRRNPVDNYLDLWDLSSGKYLRTFKGHIMGVTSVAFSPDGHFVLTGSADNTLRLWEVNSGQCVQTFEGHTQLSVVSNVGVEGLNDGFIYAGINAVAISKDGRFGLSGAMDRTVKLWDLTTGNTVRTLSSDDFVDTVAFVSGKRQVLSANLSKYDINLWDIDKGTCLFTFKGHTGRVTSLACSSDGRYILSGSADKTIRLWELSEGDLQSPCIFIGHTGEVTAVSLSPDNRWAVSAGRDNTLRQWEVATGRCIRTFSVENPIAVKFVPDGRYIYSCTNREILQKWPLVTPQPQKEVLSRPVNQRELAQQSDDIVNLKCTAKSAFNAGDFAQAYSAICDIMKAGYSDNTEMIRLRRQIGLFGRPVGLYSVKLSTTYNKQFFNPGWLSRTVSSRVLSHDRKFVFLIDKNKSDDIIWEVGTDNCQLVPTRIKGSIQAISFDGHIVLTHDSGRIRAWELATGKRISELKHPKRSGSWNSCCPISSDGRFAIVSDYGIGTFLWDVFSGKRLIKMPLDGGYPICFSLNNRYALLESGRELVLVDIFKTERVKLCSNEPIRLVTMSYDAKWVLMTSPKDHLIRIFDIPENKITREYPQYPTQIFEGHTAPITSLTLSPSGRHVISSSADNVVLLWDLPTGNCLSKFEGEYIVESVGFSQDGRFALIFSSDTRAWELVLDYEFPEPTEWNEGAKPYLDHFLSLHSTGKNCLGKWEIPIWNDEDFKKLIMDLQYRGYGWLRPEGVRKKLEEMTANWKGPPPLPGE